MGRTRPAKAPRVHPEGALVIAFTGARGGMTAAQESALDALLGELAADHPTRTLRGLHGDCVGADAGFDALCKRRSIAVAIRPASIPGMRAGCDSEAIAEPRAPLVRNREIVADADLLIACPSGRGRRSDGAACGRRSGRCAARAGRSS
ncbi:MAG: hypothetical protein H6711_25985 [Myxococcales bacterium]|nr:hypothetical protein [Myxococcales bacterium]